MVTEVAKKPFLFKSKEGKALCLKILKDNPLLPFRPHDAQLEGICAALDKDDLLAVLPTGYGKTGLFFMYMLVMRALAKDRTLYPGGWKGPSDPIMVIICPTIFIERQIVES